jgi:prepilin-type N-terminal cleavage/methylation domain-containing protein
MRIPTFKKIIKPFVFHKRKAFTLTEIAIVLGVVGVVLAGVWTAAGKVYTNHKVSLAVQETMSLAESLRKVYKIRGTVDNGNLTQFAVNSGMYRPDMLSPLSCDTAAPAGNDGLSITPCPVHPWNGEMAIGGGTFGCSSCTTDNFTIVLYGLTNSQCVPFLTALIPRAVNDGLYAINYSGIGSRAVTSSTGFDDATVLGCSSGIILQFKL